MSTVIIGGGGNGKAAVNRLVGASLTANTEQFQRAQALLDQFIAAANALAEEIENQQ